MIRHARSILTLAAAVMLTACQSLHRDADPQTIAASTSLDNGYALLYSTLEDEAKVDKVLTIKDPNPQVVDVLKAISQFSLDATKRIESLATQNPTLSLETQGLPDVEAQTRDAIGSATSKQILFSGGREFEFNILMTQHEALKYITHLADTLHKQEENDDRKRLLEQVAEQSKSLHEQVLEQLKRPYVGPSE